MNILNLKFKKTALLVAISFSLLGCGGSSLDRIVDDIDTDRQAKISFVNALDEMADFHAKVDYLNRDLFDNRQKAKTVINNETSDFSFKWIDNGTQRSSFGVRDTNTNTTSVKIDTDIDNNANYWMIAWLDGGNYQLTEFKKSTYSETDRFVVRVFSNTVLPVRINEVNDVVAMMEKGKVSVPFSINNCAAGLNVGGNNIEFCNQAEFGKSYLAVVDSDGKITVIEER